MYFDHPKFTNYKYYFNLMLDDATIDVEVIDFQSKKTRWIMLLNPNSLLAQARKKIENKLGHKQFSFVNNQGAEFEQSDRRIDRTFVQGPRLLIKLNKDKDNHEAILERQKTEYAYILLKEIDLWGGDIIIPASFSNYNQALLQAKKRISFDEAVGATIVGNKVYIKELTKTSPYVAIEGNKNLAKDCDFLLYGKRHHPKQKLVSDYITIKGLDMCGGDLSYHLFQTYEDALNYIRKKINKDSTKCGHIKSWGAKTTYYVWFKELQKTNATASLSHKYSETIFYGKIV